MEAADRRRRRGLDLAHQPAFPLGRVFGSAAKAGVLALVSALALGCALLAVDVIIHWNLVIAVYEALTPAP